MDRRTRAVVRKAEAGAAAHLDGVDALLAKMSGKLPPPPPAPPHHSHHDHHLSRRPTADPARELMRARAVRRLHANVEEALLDTLGAVVCARLSLHSRLTLRNGDGLFDRWMLRRSLHASDEAKACDPLLPWPKSSGAVDLLLVRELEAAQAPRDLALQAARAMEAAAAAASRWVARSPARAHKPVAIRRVLRRGNRMVTVASGSQAHDVTEEHLTRLRSMWNGGAAQSVAESDAGFRMDVFCLLQRYASLGGDGFQAALPPRAFAVLRHRFGVHGECFASPLNCAFEDSFCSAFPDTDSAFGSRGTFFDVFVEAREQELEGCYEANPPFEETVVDAMALRVVQLLKAADAAGRALGFIVVLPESCSPPHLARLCGGPHCRRRLILPQRGHYYTQGRQHAHPLHSLRKATSDTAIHIFQSAAAASRWPASDAACAELEGAFRGDQQCVTHIDKESGAPKAEESAPQSDADRVGESSLACVPVVKRRRGTVNTDVAPAKRRAMTVRLLPTGFRASVF